MTQRTVVHIPEEIANKYRFVVITGKRCEQLQRGAYPKVEVQVPMNKLGQPQEAPRLASFWAQVAIKEVEEGRNYALLLSTCAGAWRYLIGDTLKFTNTKTCEIQLTGRTKHFLNLCGEHLSQDNMNRAVKMLQDEMNIMISEFTVCGIRHGSLFGHKWYLGTDSPADPLVLAGRLDDYLKTLNDDYRVERLEAIREIQAEIIPLQAFYDWMKAQGKKEGLINFPAFLKISS